MHRRIVIVNQSSGYLMRDIAKAYHHKGYDVVLMASPSDKNTDVLSEKEGIRIDPLIAYNKSSAFRRLWTWTFATIQVLYKLWIDYREDELLIVSNPPFAPLVALVVRNRFSLCQTDQ